MVISDYFRIFDNMEEGVKGYFELLQLPRYQNLKGITEPGRYLETIWADGYATSSVYVQKNMELIEQYQLTKYDENVSGRRAQDVLNVMRSWIGYSEANGKFRQIIDLYNSHQPLARGYAVQYTDEWCDTAVSAAAIQAGCVDLIGTECGCEKHIEIFKERGSGLKMELSCHCQEISFCITGTVRHSQMTGILITLDTWSLFQDK